MHLDRLTLISKMRNLENDVSYDQSVLTADIFRAPITRLFLTTRRVNVRNKESLLNGKGQYYWLPGNN
jgi:hypothetical protein